MFSINVTILKFEFVHSVPMYRWKSNGDWKSNLWFDLFRMPLLLMHYQRHIPWLSLLTVQTV